MDTQVLYSLFGVCLGGRALMESEKMVYPGHDFGVARIGTPIRYKATDIIPYNGQTCVLNTVKTYSQYFEVTGCLCEYLYAIYCVHMCVQE